MKILAIDTSCDETAAAVTEDTKVLSNIIWSQASLHAKFGGVMPSLAQRQHEEHIDFVVDKAIQKSKIKFQNLDAIAVTIGPGLSIALGVGITKAKELAKKYNKSLIAVNHLEAHLLSSLALGNSVQRIAYSQKPITNPLLPITFPALGLVVSGGNTQLILVKKIGNYEILAETQDDALGEALDKGARMLGFGYPGGAILEKLARGGDLKSYDLPLPLVNDKVKNRFSYSGLKTAMSRKIEEVKTKNGELTKQNIYDFAASFQDVAFQHIVAVLKYQINHSTIQLSNHFLLGGGVANNVLLRNKLRKLLKPYGIILHVPYSKKLLGDNAAMIGVTAYFKAQRGEFTNPEKIDRNPRLKLGQ